MTGVEQLLDELYAAFNRRDVDGALRLMTEGVDWPKASEGGRVVGKEAIREYWQRQWREFDPHVKPVAVQEREDGRVEVRVHQLVKDLRGEVLADGEVLHVYTLLSGLVERMDVGGAEGAAGERPSAAFTRS